MNEMSREWINQWINKFFFTLVWQINAEEMINEWMNNKLVDKWQTNGLVKMS